MEPSAKLVNPWRVDTGRTIRVFDPQRGICLCFEKYPQRSWTTVLLLVRSDILDVCEPIWLQFGMS